MFDSFDARLRALLEDDGLDDAHGGGIAKHGDRFSYRLYDQPEPADGEAFLDLPRSSTPEVKWRAWMVTDEAREAYRAFVTNPDNGVLYRNVL